MYLKRELNHTLATLFITRLLWCEMRNWGDFGLSNGRFLSQNFQAPFMPAYLNFSLPQFFQLNVNYYISIITGYFNPNFTVIFLFVYLYLKICFTVEKYVLMFEYNVGKRSIHSRVQSK